ncbi:hypothetical protein E1B28_010399 [Marasmius oreades]|uniref:Uncharacterized protein n=1 Tax=Marasmius oreades TaxID=181124 RepID=A0A9P7RXQ5_9AGAR|nr:uncharacterized protein E1B28_010399 [Marasmius oreades]KAG7091357.1 hypothetical protein E1B28_010399 [Marasmius oreades]
MNTVSNTLDGKGPIQPHVSNLPRRKPRRLLTNVRDANREIRRKPLSSSSKNASGRQTSSSSSSNKTNYLSNSQLPNAFSGSGLNENVITRETTPSLPHSLVLPLPKPKGHVQPHADHLPRRKRVQLNPQQLRRKWRQKWAASMYKQEVLKGSGVWVAFDLNDLGIRGIEGEDVVVDEVGEATRREVDEYAKEIEESHLLTFQHIVKVVVSSTVADGADIEEYGQTVKLFIFQDCQSDDGVPCVSNEQLLFISRLVQDRHGSAVASGVDERKERILITVPYTRSTDAMALAIVACRAAGIRSISLTNAPTAPTRVHSRAPTRTSSPEPSSSLRTEIPSSPPILSTDPMTQAGAIQSPALTYLARMYDLEDLDEAWKGALSFSGLERVNVVLETI